MIFERNLLVLKITWRKVIHVPVLGETYDLNQQRQPRKKCVSLYNQLNINFDKMECRFHCPLEFKILFLKRHYIN